MTDIRKELPDDGDSMGPLEQHEQFEIEVLHFLNSKRLLHPLVLGGGTMLRLCYDMSRYSVDMDFYFKKKSPTDLYFEKLNQGLESKYVITDSHEKYRTILIELTHAQYPRKLKIEINRRRFYPTFTQAIAFSPHSTYQVLVNVIPLDEMMRNKIDALLARKEIRDAHDIDFLIKRGVEFPRNRDTIEAVLESIREFSKRDFDVKLASLLPADIRKYYRENRFSDLETRLINTIRSASS